MHGNMNVKFVWSLLARLPKNSSKNRRIFLYDKPILPPPQIVIRYRETHSTFPTPFDIWFCLNTTDRKHDSKLIDLSKLINGLQVNFILVKINIVTWNKWDSKFSFVCIPDLSNYLPVEHKQTHTGPYTLILLEGFKSRPKVIIVIQGFLGFLHHTRQINSDDTRFLQHRFKFNIN
jgi:hypothetical protein